MISTLEQLRSLYAQPAERAVRKQQDRLDSHCQEWMALSPMLVMATAGSDGALVDAWIRVRQGGRVWEGRSPGIPDLCRLGLADGIRHGGGGIIRHGCPWVVGRCGGIPVLDGLQ